MPPELGSPDLPLSPRVTGDGLVKASGQPPTWTVADGASPRGLGFCGGSRQGAERERAQSLPQPAAPGSREGRTTTPAPRRLPRVRVWGVQEEPPTSTQKPGKLFLAQPLASFEFLRPRPGRRWRQLPAINPEVN